MRRPGSSPGLVCEVDGFGLFGPALEDEGAVGAAEAEGVGERVVDLRGLGLVGDVVEAALGVELDDVHGRRGGLVEHGHDGDAGFEAAGAAEQVAGHGLGGADEERVVEGALAEDVFDGLGLKRVAERGGGGVGVDVVDLVGGDAGDLEGGFMARKQPSPSGAMPVMWKASADMP